MLASFNKSDYYYSPRLPSHFSYFYYHFTNATGVLISPYLDQERNKLTFLSEEREFSSASSLAGEKLDKKLILRVEIALSLNASELVSLLISLRIYQQPVVEFCTSKVFVLHFIWNLTCLPFQCQPQCILWTLIPYLLLAPLNVMDMNVWNTKWCTNIN